MLLLDATDALENDGEVSTQAGLHPRLAVLERLLRSPTDQGTTLFSWGARALPVEVAELTIIEQLFDQSLAPLHAEVQVALQMLNDADAKGNKAVHRLLESHDGWQLQQATQVTLELDRPRFEQEDVPPEPVGEHARE